MCDVCGFIHCPSGCPNYEPAVVGKCEKCDEEIYAGDSILNLDGYLYHEDCLKDMSISELVELFDYEIETAEEAI